MPSAMNILTHSVGANLSRTAPPVTAVTTTSAQHEVWLPFVRRRTTTIAYRKDHIQYEEEHVGQDAARTAPTAGSHQRPYQTRSRARYRRAHPLRQRSQECLLSSVTAHVRANMGTMFHHILVIDNTIFRKLPASATGGVALLKAAVQIAPSSIYKEDFVA